MCHPAQARPGRARPPLMIDRTGRRIWSTGRSPRWLETSCGSRASGDRRRYRLKHRSGGESPERDRGWRVEGVPRHHPEERADAVPRRTCRPRPIPGRRAHPGSSAWSPTSATSTTKGSRPMMARRRVCTNRCGCGAQVCQERMTVTQRTAKSNIERKAEQLYFDAVLGHREGRRANLRALAPPSTRAPPRVCATLRPSDRQLRGPEEAVAFGRIDSEVHDSAGTFYVGHNAIWNEDTKDVLVVNWRADVASPYYAATHKDPQGLHAEAVLLCESNTIVDFDDLVFAEFAARVAALRTRPSRSPTITLLQRSRSQPHRRDAGDRPHDPGCAVRDRARPSISCSSSRVARARARLPSRLHRRELAALQQGRPRRTGRARGRSEPYLRPLHPFGPPSLGDRNVRHADSPTLGAVRCRLGRDEEPAVVQAQGRPADGEALDRGVAAAYPCASRGRDHRQGRSHEALG